MKLKQVEEIDVYITKDGRIALKQFSNEFEIEFTCCMTIDQFFHIQNFFYDNESIISKLWNDGVEDDSEA